MDFRLKDNPALFHAVKEALNSQQSASERPLVYALYVISPADWKSHHVSPRKVDFMLRNLRLISHALWNDYRIPLIVRHAGTAKSVVTTVIDECKRFAIGKLFFNNEYEIDESRRDSKIVETLTSEQSIQVFRYDDQVVVKPGTLRSKSSGGVFCVYTPFKKAWFDLVKNHRTKYLSLCDLEAKIVNEVETRLSEQPSEIPAFVPGFELSAEDGKRMAELYPAGETAAHERLEMFAISDRMSAYKDKRDFPSTNGTSSMSPYLASGVISPKQCVIRAMKANNGKLDSGSEGIIVWIQEIIWREFYRNILFAFPRVCMNKPFKLNTMAVPWRVDEKEYQAFIEGKTGYPIVDAGMRQLKETGWMHNRVRMIVASFLTKHLLHHWLEGEKIFNENLIDGDFASNNGGWQWAASTGTDSQPYFRIFNPYLQSKKFDPTGEYIRKYVPELKNVKSNEAIHNPELTLGKQGLAKIGYPSRIVDHEFARKRALDAFKSASGEKDDETLEKPSGNGKKMKIDDDE